MTSLSRLLFLLVTPLTLWSQRSGDFLLVARRSGIAEILDAVTLQTVTRIHFDFHETGLDELRHASEGKTPEPLIRWCYAENSDQRIPAAEACTTGGH